MQWHRLRLAPLSLIVMIGCAKEEPAAAPIAPTAPAPVKKAAPTPTETGAAAPQRVKLGTAELTAGIRGEGELSAEQIQAWVDNAGNHVPLEVELPRGLAAGARAMVIPEHNPLTRAKIELGRQLYFERRLSAGGTVSCADCHHPDDGYARHTQFGVGINGQTGARNSPVAYNRILSGAQFWDGRADSLEAQAVGPIANPIEMGNTHEAAVETLKGIEGYRVQFQRIFDDGVTIDNVGRAIASFERAIVTGPAPYDYYEPVRALQQALGETLNDLEALKNDDPDVHASYTAALADSEAHPISEQAKRGREIFFGERGKCTDCHVGANFTDEKYHNIGIGMDKEQPDLGRFVVTKDEKDRGAFKTPTVRNVTMTAPYMHDGSLKTLAEVVQWYDRGGHPNPQLSSSIKKLNLSDEEKSDLVAFLEACTGELPEVQTGRLPQ